MGIVGGTIGGAAGVAKYLARNKWEKEDWFPHQKESIKAENDVKILNEIPTPTPKVAKQPIEPSIVHYQHPNPDMLPEKTGKKKTPLQKILPSQKWSAAPQMPVQTFPYEQQHSRHTGASRSDNARTHANRTNYEDDPFVVRKRGQQKHGPKIEMEETAYKKPKRILINEDYWDHIPQRYRSPPSRNSDE